MYIGDYDNLQGGVAIMMSQRAKKTLIGWTHVNKRMIKARFYSKHKKVTIIQVYSPTNEATEDKKEDFYRMLLQDVIGMI